MGIALKKKIKAEIKKAKKAAKDKKKKKKAAERNGLFEDVLIMFDSKSFVENAIV